MDATGFACANYRVDPSHSRGRRAASTTCPRPAHPLRAAAATAASEADVDLRSLLVEGGAARPHLLLWRRRRRMSRMGRGRGRGQEEEEGQEEEQEQQQPFQREKTITNTLPIPDSGSSSRLRSSAVSTTHHSDLSPIKPR